MIQNNHAPESLGEAIRQVAIGWVLYIGAISVEDVAQWVALVGGLMVIAHTGLQIYVLWRDKVIRRRPVPVKEPSDE